jgi:hypothetical protein
MMQFDRNSVAAGYAAGVKRMRVELEQFKQQAALDYFELRRELDAALAEVRETKLEFLNFKAAVTHDRQMLTKLHHERALVSAQLAERDPAQLLH